MAEEGTINFAYELTTPASPLLDPAATAQLSAWRSILRDLDLLGQHPDRYNGYGYGNISVLDGQGQIIVTASQTSAAPELSASDLTRITGVSFERFWLDAEGSQPPSSETLTHAMCYASDARLRAVVHVHCPEIWNHAEALSLPATPPDVAYGTPAMASAVHQLIERYQTRPLVFVTPGHEDGVFACGAELGLTTSSLITVLARARQAERSS